MHDRLFRSNYLSHYVMEGEVNAQAQLSTLLVYPISVRQETPTDANEVRAIECRPLVLCIAGARLEKQIAK